MRRNTKVALGGAFAIASALIFIALLVHALWYAPDPDIAVATATTTPLVVPPEAYPAHLLIPSLSIDAKVQYVGIKADGAMAAPSNFTDVGWYKYGTVPGQKGSAVIAGHVDNGLALAGVFKYLKDLKNGDDIFIETKDGTKIHFIVSDIESYPYNDAPTEKIFTADDAARLNLITCTGTWIKAGRMYSERLVVYAIRVS